MKIDRIEIFQVVVPLEHRYSTSYDTVDEFPHIFVKIYTNDGVTGWGEVSSLPTFTGESIGTITAVIKELGSVIAGYDPFDMEKILNLMDKKIKFNNTAKAAIDFALHDIIGKSLSLNTIFLIGGKYIEKIPLSWSLTIGDPSKVEAEAVKMVEAGFDTVNLKIGTNPDEDIERVRRVRKAVGDKVNIRADANGAFTSMKAIQIIRRMEEYNLQYVEQPVPGWDLDGMVDVRNRVNTPISADESIFYFHDAIEVIKKGAADIFALKVAKYGGIRRTKQIVAIAEAANIPCMMNSNCELDIGVSAAAMVTASTRMVQYSSEISGPLRHRTDVIKKGVEYRNGFLIPTTGPGLGIEIDDKKMERYRVF